MDLDFQGECVVLKSASLCASIMKINLDFFQTLRWARSQLFTSNELAEFGQAVPERNTVQTDVFRYLFNEGDLINLTWHARANQENCPARPQK